MRSVLPFLVAAALLYGSSVMVRDLRRERRRTDRERRRSLETAYVVRAVAFALCALAIAVVAAVRVVAG